MEEKRLFEAGIITLGDGQVGKSSIILRYTDDKFHSIYLSTIGFDTKIKNIVLNNGEEIKVKLYDTAGQERFKSIAKTYLKKANGILLIYDITRETSFNNVINWVKDINEGTHTDIPVVLIGNKSDLEDERTIKKEDGEKLAKQFGYENHFYETSCLNGEKVKEAVNDLVEQIYKKYGNNSQNKSVQIKKPKNNKTETGCCSNGTKKK